MKKKMLNLTPARQKIRSRGRGRLEMKLTSTPIWLKKVLRYTARPFSQMKNTICLKIKQGIRSLGGALTTKKVANHGSQKNKSVLVKKIL